MRLSLTLLLALITGYLSANPLEPIPETLRPQPFIGLMYARHEGAFYDQQAADWKTIATGECATDEAWFHYYKTAIYSNRFGSGEHDLPAILAAAEERCDPEGFDLNYIQFVADNRPVKRWDKLMRAHTIDPQRIVAYTAIIGRYEVLGEHEKRDDLLRRIHERNPISSGVMTYNFNQLHSVGPGGILLTNGDADTYPSWLLQSFYGVRTDVRVVNLALLLGYATYRENVFRELGLTATADDTSDFSALIEQLADQSRPLYLAATTRTYFEQLESTRLYPTGLAFWYTEDKVDNIGALASNYANVWRLDQLRQPLAEGPVQAVVDELNQNYLPALLELNEYRREEKGSGLSDVLPLIKTLAKRAGRSEEVATYLRDDSPPQLASKNPKLRAKEIYKKAVYIEGGTLYHQDPDDANKAAQEVAIQTFFMQDVEVSNADYQLFLEDLLRQRKFRMLDSAAVAPLDQEQLKKVFPESYDLEAYATHISGSNPSFVEYPVLNVSRRAVALYAIWLAQVYNQDPKRIDGKNVRFRLPTAQEFEYAARGGKKSAPYPWGGPYTRNSKGCYLANFNTMLPQMKKGVGFLGTPGNLAETHEARKARLDALLKNETCGGPGDDGGVLTVKVTAYFPNDYGLYNMAGNAGEMIAEEGKTMGGSWMDEDYYMQVATIKEQTVPHPSTGFRLIMEYVD